CITLKNIKASKMQIRKVLIPLIIIIATFSGIMFFLRETLENIPENQQEENWIFEDSRLDRTAIIHLPIKVEDLTTEPHDGPIGPWGYHGGNHPEGFDHTGFVFKEPSPIYAPDDGLVVYIEKRASDDIKIIIFHNYTIASWFDHLTNITVSEKDFVTEGQIIGYSKQYGLRNIVDWGLIDRNNNTGPIFPGCESAPEGGSFVPPFNYLVEEDRAKIEAIFNETMLQPFLNGEFVPGMNKAEHGLINPVFPERSNPEDIAGVWILEDGNKWGPGGPPEILTFIHRNTTYFGEVFHAVYADFQRPVEFDTWDANFEINTSVTPHRIKLIFAQYGEETKAPLYGIYEVNASGSRTKLKIEFSENGYPMAFSSNASIYIIRSRYHPLQEINIPETAAYSILSGEKPQDISLNFGKTLLKTMPIEFTVNPIILKEYQTNL
ncbi:MAG: M23 family metallopeptidase, partial [Candidatus Korarchaeota archaeon]|nr:M23 family metallopeptidase [Candidatus Korarchaeota archaeon]